MTVAAPAPAVVASAWEPVVKEDVREEPHAGAPVAAPSSAWRLSFTPYLWALDIDGGLETGGRTLPISSHLSDAIDLVESSVPLAGRVEASRGDWSFFVDSNYTDVESERSASRSILSVTGAPSADLDLDVRFALVEVGAAWRAADFDCECGGAGSIEILGGARWNHLEMDAELDGASAGPRAQFDRTYDADFKSDWVDPFVGVRAVVPVADDIALHLRGDIGGGVGSGSDVAWNVVAGISVGLSRNVDLFAGYRWYDFERDVSGRDTRLQVEGPTLGVTIRF